MATRGTQKFILQGLDCASCAAKIETAVQRETGLSEAAINFSTRSMFIPPEFAPQVQQIIDRIEPGVKLVAAGAGAGAATGAATGVTSAAATMVATGAGFGVPGGSAEDGHRFSADHGHTYSNDHGHEHGALDRRRLIEIGVAAVLFVVGLIFYEPLRGTTYGIGEYLVFFPAYWLVGRGVIGAAVRNARRGQFFDENSLMTIATIGAILIRELPEAVGVMLFYAVGEAFQDYAVDRSRRSIAALMDIRPDYANVRRDGQTRRVHPEEVAVGEEIVVRPGERIPLDGDVVEGSSSVDTSALTGESLPRHVEAGAAVLAGMVNTSGLLVIRVTKPFGESSVAKILELVEHAGARKARTERFMTRFSRYYTPAVVLAAIGVAFVPPLFIDGAQLSEWVYRALVLLVISCPCALVLSIPVGYFGGIGGASRQGILVKGANFLDALARLDTVVMDKTGTLTQGVFKVRSVSAYNGFTDDEVLRYAAYAESFSQHPIAASIVNAYAGRVGGAGGVNAADRFGAADRGRVGEIERSGVDGNSDGNGNGNGWCQPSAASIVGPRDVRSASGGVGDTDACRGDGHENAQVEVAASNLIDGSRVQDYKEIAGHGVIARIDGKTVVAGNDRILHRESVPHDRCDAQGTVVNVAVDGRLAGQVIVADEIKEDAAEAIRLLKELGVSKTVMLTGDHKDVAQQVAAVLGIDEAYSELLPEEKVQVLERIAGDRANRGGTIAFVGDGINDAPVLTRADVGIAMGGLGQDAAIEAADVVIMDDRPSKIARAIAIARRTRRIVLQNIVFALSVKAAVIVLGTIGMASMWGAVFADVGVSLLAVLNSMRALRA